MPVRFRRAAVAAILTTAAIAVPVAAFASSSGSPATLKEKAATGPSASATSQSRLDAGLAAAKRAGGADAAGITAFARTDGVSRATAQRIVDAAFGAGAVDRTKGNKTGL